MRPGDSEVGSRGARVRGSHVRRRLAGLHRGVLQDSSRRN